MATTPLAPKVATPASGLLAGAMKNVTAPDTTSNVAKIDTNPLQPTGKTAAQAKATGYTAEPTASTGYTALGAKTEDWKVNDDQTVAGLVAKYTDPSSAVMQRAQSQALQQANGLGLKNSSIAAGAGTAAMLDRALSMATPDAATYADAGKFNAGAKNTASLADQQAANAASQFTAAAKNSAAAADAEAVNTARQFEAGAQNTASSQNAQASNQLQGQQLGLLANAMGQNAQAQNSASEATAQRQTQVGLAQYDAAMRAAMQDADAQTKVMLSDMDAQMKTSLAGIEAEFKTQMQTSQSAAAMYSETIKAIGAIMTDKDMDAGNKQNMINQQMTALRNSLSLQAAITKIPGLDNLINGVNAGVAGAPAAPAPAPAPAKEPAPSRGGEAP